MRMVLIMYDNWLSKASEKINVDGRMRPRMSKMQIKEILRLCTTADKVEFLSDGTLYQFR